LSTQALKRKSASLFAVEQDHFVNLVKKGADAFRSSPSLQMLLQSLQLDCRITLQANGRIFLLMICQVVADLVRIQAREAILIILGDVWSHDGGEEAVDGYAGEILEGDDDDTGWMGHTLQFRKDATMDQHSIDEYEVVDPRDKNMTLEDAKRQEARLKRHSEQSGRLKAGASAKAERSIRGREDGGGRNFGRERH